MRVVKTTQTKLCVDGSLMKEYVLDEPLNERFITYLQNFGEVKILMHLKKPFLSFEKEFFISVKGIVGEDIVEVRYKKGVHDLVSDYFHLLLSYFHDGDPEVEKVKQIEKAIWAKMETRIKG